MPMRRSGGWANELATVTAAPADPNQRWFFWAMAAMVFDLSDTAGIDADSLANCYHHCLDIATNRKSASVDYGRSICLENTIFNARA